MNNKNKKGFTLIELLVVIAIIGLLSTLSVVALNNARARARDARRVADIKQIQTALELYFNANNKYPTSTSAEVASTALTDDLEDFMSPIPTAPTPADCTTGNEYMYQTAATPATYTLTYCLGSETGGLDAGAGTATEMTISSSD
jgi:type II secretion system protein G